ncbi:hypothetical protein MVES1_000037 [Malassezia vespertilionis]|uniref:FHA domain-containing protein n=1 Tax=Malassezia vespertilionis TaxID=2020962 RepID=A0A2N1JGT9_9BASI|nr:uncharacterized protein MVES1_000037 [Malassezia vespertilionis]PKI85760.1 hypothetical protein MVES_000035 [Malassezia vespertilionis]WFD04713.1 hypothetical protein MVES1_000037 [Malassezia vespertilionis]
MAIATPPPSSDAVVISSPSAPMKHGAYTRRSALATPPPSSPTRDHPFGLFVEALDYAAQRKGTSPIKRAHLLKARTAVVKAPALGIHPAEPLDLLRADHSHTLAIGRAKVLDSDTACTMCPTFIGTLPLVNVCLPGDARHVSRLHAFLRWVPFTSADARPDAIPGTFVLRIVGQNGLIVNGKRLRVGQVVRVEPGKTVIDFFGHPMQFVASEPVVPPAAPPQQRRSDGSSPQKRVVHERDTTDAVPPSSPGVFAREHVPSSPSSDSQCEMPFLPSSPSHRASTLPARCTLAEENSEGTTALHVIDDDPFSAPEPKAKLSESPLVLARDLAARLAQTYDVAGLLAGAIVFHRTATISSSEAVRSVLSTNPGMLRGEAGARTIAYSPSKCRLQSESDGRVPAYGQAIAGWQEGAAWQTHARRAWHELLEAELQRAPMFGAIQRPGKDTSGNPLECWYYYDKENDPDLERAVNLGAFVKPMRNAVRSQKPIFWKKSEYSRATSSAGNGLDPYEDDKLPYSPRSQYGGESTGDESGDARQAKRARKLDSDEAKLRRGSGKNKLGTI